MSSKFCKKCETIKDCSEFNKDKIKKDGLASSCRKCQKEYLKDYYKNNKEIFNVSSYNYYKEHKEEILEKTKEKYYKNIDLNRENGRKRSLLYRTEHREEYRKKNREWASKNRKEHPEKCRIIDALYLERNREKVNLKNQRRREKNLELYRKRDKKYYNQRKEYYILKAHKRRALLLNAMPLWLTEDDILKIKSYFKLAQEKEKIDGIKYHVDHIVPLINKNVCGLHVPWNLQVIPAKDNLKKGNRI